MITNEAKSEFFPKLMPGGWRIRGFVCGRECSIAKLKGVSEPLIFGREQDAKAAIRGLAEHGILSPSDVMKRERSEVVKICIESLGW